MKKVMIMTGEASGDMYGANLARELKKQDPSIILYGVGSKNMREAGVRMLADASEISVVGIAEALTHLWRMNGPIVSAPGMCSWRNEGLLRRHDRKAHGVADVSIVRDRRLDLVIFYQPRKD